jgi:hypothetical protein
MLLQEPQKLFSETPQQHEDESDQEERPEGVEITLVTCQQPSEAAKPSEGSLHLPTLRVTRTGLHGPTSFRGFSWAPLVGGDSGFDSPTAQPAPEVLTVCRRPCRRSAPPIAASDALVLCAGPARFRAWARPVSSRGVLRSPIRGLWEGPLHQ